MNRSTPCGRIAAERDLPTIFHTSVTEDHDGGRYGARMDALRKTAIRTSGAPTGFALGLFGYLAALVAFGYEGLFTGRADPADQLGGGLAASYLVGLVATISVVVGALRTRSRQPWKAVGLAAGMAAGVVLLTLLSVRIVPVMQDAPGGCDCSPLIDQIRMSPP